MSAIKHETDILILGGGASGLAAALAAAEAGAKRITVIEKQASTGGMGRCANGLFGCESPVQRREMFDVTADECFNIHMDWAHWFRVDPPLVRAFLRRSGETIAWLEGKGVNFDLRKSWPNQNAVWHIPDKGGAGLMLLLRREAEERGVEFVCSAEAKRLIMADGRVAGAVVSTAEGDIEFVATQVILATGGFGGNPELLEQYCPTYDPEIPIEETNRCNTGAGLIMAREAGAAIAKTVPVLYGGHWVDSGMAPGTPPLISVTTDPLPIWLDCDGRRFCDEGAFYADFAACGLRHKYTWALFDDDVRRRLEEEGPTHGGDAPGHSKTVRGIPGLDSIFDKYTVGRRGEFCRRADTLEEIADFAGFDLDVLKDTLERFNAACACGYDSDFLKERRLMLPVKKAPYYIIRCCVNFHDTCGGIRVTENMQVRDPDDRPMPGLYAIGSLSDGVEPDVYNWKLCSFAFGFAINSGRIAGEAAAAAL